MISYRNLLGILATYLFVSTSTHAAPMTNGSSNTVDALFAIGAYEGRHDAAYDRAVAKAQKDGSFDRDWGGTWSKIKKAHPGRITVYVGLNTSPATLIVSAYDPTIFTVKQAKPGLVRRIVVYGYGRNTVNGNLGKVTVENLSGKPFLANQVSLHYDDREPVYLPKYSESNRRFECSNELVRSTPGDFQSALDTIKAKFAGLPQSIIGGYTLDAVEVDSTLSGIKVSNERLAGYCYKDPDGVIREQK